MKEIMGNVAIACTEASNTIRVSHLDFYMISRAFTTSTTLH